MKSSSRFYFLISIGTAMLFVGAAYYFKFSWTGYESKTLWDWMDLLIVPSVLAVGGLLYNRNEKKAEQERAEKQAQSEREIAKDNQQETVLQSYLSAMTELMLKYDLKEAKVATIAQARTTGVLNRLDPKRKITTLNFLADAGLLSTENPVISLGGADFSGIGPLTLHFNRVALTGINLSGSQLAGSTFSECDLRYADLTNTNLSDSNLFGSNFCGAHLTNTVFSKAVIFKADFSKGAPIRADMNPRVVEKRTRERNEEWLTNLKEANFKYAKYDYSTMWPGKFDKEAAGAVNAGD